MFSINRWSFSTWPWIGTARWSPPTLPQVRRGKRGYLVKFFRTKFKSWAGRNGGFAMIFLPKRKLQPGVQLLEILVCFTEIRQENEHRHLLRNNDLSSPSKSSQLGSKLMENARFLWASPRKDRSFLKTAGRFMVKDFLLRMFLTPIWSLATSGWECVATPTEIPGAQGNLIWSGEADVMFQDNWVATVRGDQTFETCLSSFFTWAVQIPPI